MSQQINLFNPIFLKQKKVFTVVPMAEALALILLGALAVAFYGNRRVASLEKEALAVKLQLAAREARLASVDTEFAPRQKSYAVEVSIAQAETRLRALREVAAILQRGDLGNTLGYAEYFRALSRQSVHGLWLTGVSITGAGNEIGVQGRAMQAPLIPHYIARLKNEAVMRGKTFGSLDIVQAGAAVEAADAPKLDASGPALVAAPPYVEFHLQTVAAGAADKAVPK
ncbi:MAG: hypothetical protein V4754_02775 [Pseudomonadota bacterium]